MSETIQPDQKGVNDHLPKIQCTTFSELILFSGQLKIIFFSFSSVGNQEYRLLQNRFQYSDSL